MNNQEIWKDVVGFDNYQVSSIGRVKTKQRSFIRTNKSPMTIKEKIKKQYLSKKGYCIVSLNITGDRITYNKQVHQLVAMAFLGHKPCGHKLVVDHINEDKTDNRVENLQILTNRDNCLKSNIIRKDVGLVGVCLAKNNKYHANIVNLKDRIFIGSFENKEDAKKAYDNALNDILSGNKVTIYRVKIRKEQQEKYHVIKQKHYYPKKRKSRTKKKLSQFTIN